MDTPWLEHHRQALICALQLGDMDIHRIHELKAELVFAYLVPGGYHKLMNIMKSDLKRIHVV